MPSPNPTLPALAFLGIVTVGADVLTNGITLIDAFPAINIQGAKVATVILCTHEDNAANGVIYIGDLTMTSSPSTTAAISLLGPNVIDTSLADMGGKNTIPLGSIKIGASVANQAVRISIMVT